MFINHLSIHRRFGGETCLFIAIRADEGILFLYPMNNKGRTRHRHNDQKIFRQTMRSKKMIVKLIRNALAAVVLMAGAFAAHGTTLQLDDEKTLFRIQGVNVNGVFYDVILRDGSCDTLFGGCSTSSFAFTNYDDSRGASQALLELIFLDSRLENPEPSRPSFINGCQRFDECLVLTPYAADEYGLVDVIVAQFYRPYAVILRETQLMHDVDTQTIYDYTYAVWTKSAAVPEPASLALFGVGALAATAMRRRKKA